MHLIRVTIDDDDDDDDAGFEVNFSLQTNTSNKLIMLCDILNSNAIHFIWGLTKLMSSIVQWRSKETQRMFSKRCVCACWLCPMSCLETKHMTLLHHSPKSDYFSYNLLSPFGLANPTMFRFNCLFITQGMPCPIENTDEQAMFSQISFYEAETWLCD